MAHQGLFQPMTTGQPCKSLILVEWALLLIPPTPPPTQGQSTHRNSFETNNFSRLTEQFTWWSPLSNVYPLVCLQPVPQPVVCGWDSPHPVWLSFRLHCWGSNLSVPARLLCVLLRSDLSTRVFSIVHVRSKSDWSGSGWCPVWDLHC